MFLEYWMIVVMMVVFAAGLVSTYAKSYMKGVRTVQGTIDKALVLGFESIMKSLEEQGIISLQKDSAGKVHAFPASIDADKVNYLIDQIEDPIIQSELREALSVKL